MFSQSNLFFYHQRLLQKLRLILVGFFIVFVISLSNFPSIAQQITQATLNEILDSPQVFIENRPAQKNDVARAGQYVRTNRARAGFRLNNGAVLRLGQNSSLLVESQCVGLVKGQALVAGSANGCVGSIIATTKGAIYTLEVDEVGQGNLIVLEGQTAVFNQKRPDTKPILVSAGQGVELSRSGEPEKVSQQSQTELNKVLQGPLFTGFTEPLSGNDQLNKPQGEKPQGFQQTFLNDALGGNSDPLSGLASQSSNSNRFRDTPVSPIVPPKSVTGIITILEFGGSVTRGTFTADKSGNVTNINVTRTPSQTTIQVQPAITIDGTTLSINTPATTPLINGVPARDFSFGLSGNNAQVTVVGQNGQVFRATAIGVGGKVPNAGDTFPGVLSIGGIPDR